LEWEIFHKSKELSPTLIFSLGLQDFPFRQKKRAEGRNKQINKQQTRPPKKKKQGKKGVHS
jgi:hypothetical protein